MIRKFLKKIVPFRYHYFFSSDKLIRKTRKDIVILPLGQNANLEVYWREDNLGIGPAASVYIYNREVLRFDCFGEEEGHFHISTPYKGSISSDRIYYTEKNVEDQIDRTFFEIKTNIFSYVKMHPSKRIRKVYLDKNALENSAVEMKKIMKNYYMINKDKMRVSENIL
jgi:hypothetical protein